MKDPLKTLCGCQRSFLQSLGNDDLERLLSLITRQGAPYIALEEQPPDSAEDPGDLFCQVGGSFCLPGSMAIPVDIDGQPMQLLAQINFALLPPIGGLPRTGLLLCFLSRAYRSMRPKDRRWYRFCWLPESQVPGKDSGRLVDSSLPEHRLTPAVAVHLSGGPEHAPSDCAEEKRTRNLMEEFNQLPGQYDSILDRHRKGSNEARIMAAFHASGISYDRLRRVDSHYSHLVEAAGSFVNLWTSTALGLVNQDENREIYICIRREDLTAGLLEKCQPVII